MGATFNGVLIPGLSWFTLILMAFLLLLWAVVRWRGCWVWYRSPLDGIVVAWTLVFVLSLVANIETWRRILIGLWFVGVYTGVWYILNDTIQNRLIRHDMLVDSLLMSGAVVILFGFYQFSIVEYDFSKSEWPRLGSSIGNANALGVFLVVILMLAAGRFFVVQSRAAHLVLGIYILCALVLLVFTFSRGAFLGLVLAALVLGWLTLAARQTTSLSGIGQRWRQLRRSLKLMIVTTGFGLLVFIGLFSALLVWQTVSNTSRRLDLRGGIYEASLIAFAEKPLTGHGLFMFGQELARLQSQPEQQPHSHAHDVVLAIASELGIPGLVALVISAYVILLAIRRNWQASNDRIGLAAAAAALVGYSFVHLLDMPAMMPVIALVGVLVLALVVVPNHDGSISSTGTQYVISRHGTIVFPSGIGALWIVLIVTGLWSTNLYTRYYDAVRYGILEEDYRGGAERLQSVIDADPNLALYLNQQAYLYGLAANEGDNEALARGIAGYERYLELEPQDAVAWTNLGALYWQAGEPFEAVEALERAHELAPKSWQIRFQLGMYSEGVGDFVRARQFYKRHVENPFNLMFPQWNDTALRREFAAHIKPVGIALIVLALDEDMPYASYDSGVLWARSNLEKEQSTPRYILQLLVALRSDDPEAHSDQFEYWMSQAESLIKQPEERAWIHIGQAAILRYGGDERGAERELQEARDIIAPNYAKEDYKNGVNIAHFQFLRYAIVRQFLPQVTYPTVETLPMLRLLD